MNSAGRIVEIWRYPISSLGGERLAQVNLSPEGIEGDRLYGLIDAVTGLPAVPEKDVRWRKALHLQATFRKGSFPAISFPYGQSYSLDDPSLNATLTDYFGFATAVAAYDRTELKSELPLTRFRHHHFAMHLLTTASLENLSNLLHIEAVDSRRFRPTVLIEVNECGGRTFVENGWVGRRLRLGAIELAAEENTKRCGVTFISQPGLEEDSEILRSILRHNRRNLGIYCSIDGTGQIKLGDALIIES